MPKFLKRRMPNLRWKYDKIIDICVSGINTRDYPDFCDAFIEEAYWKYAETVLSESELDRLNEDSNFVYEHVMEALY